MNLTRKVGESIMIGDDIVITVLNIDGQVRLGIKAPKDIRIDREEIRAKKDKGPESGNI